MCTGNNVMKRVMAHQTAAIPELPIDDARLQQIFGKMVAKKSAGPTPVCRSPCSAIIGVLDSLDHHPSRRVLE